MTTNHPAVSCEELEPLRGVSDTLVHTQETSQPLSDRIELQDMGNQWYAQKS